MAIAWLIEMAEFAVFVDTHVVGKMKLRHTSVDHDRKITLKENQAQDHYFLFIYCSFYSAL